MSRAMCFAAVLTGWFIAGPAVGSDLASDVAMNDLSDHVRMLEEQVEAMESQHGRDRESVRRASDLRGLIEDVLADADTRSLLENGMTSGYDKGFYISSVDGDFSLRLNGQMQVRWILNRAQGQEEERGFENRRTKLKFSGHVGERAWSYKMTMAVNRSTSSAFTEDAWVQRRLDDGWSLKVGQFKAPFLRETQVSSSRQLAVERSMVNNAFTYGWTKGIALGYAGEQATFKVWYGDGPNRINTSAVGDSVDALTARAEVLLAGAWSQFKGFNAVESGDFGAMLGVGGAYVDATDLGTTIEIGNAAVTKSTSWTVDLSLAAGGWQIFGAYVTASGDDQASGFDVESSGYVVQAGYRIADDLEVFGRYEGGKVDGYTPSSHDSLSVVTVGFNCWPTGSGALKWTADFGYAFDSIADGDGGSGTSGDWTSSGNGWRSDVAGEDGQMVIRTQLQVLF